MRFKKFLEAQEKPYTHKPLGIDHLLAELKDNCMDSIHAGIDHESSQIWRGSKQSMGSGIFHPSTGSRTSENTANYYTKLLDTNSKNSEWPKRSKSFICTTKRRTAESYGGKFHSKGSVTGEVYAVFPFDTTMVGVCNKADMWECPIEFRGIVPNDTTAGWNDIWPNIWKTLGESGESYVPTMPEALAKLRDADPLKFTEEMHALGMIDSDPAELAASRKILMSFIKELPDAYSYDQMGCTLESPGEIAHDNTELWMQGSVVLVSREDWLTVAEEFHGL